MKKQIQFVAFVLVFALLLNAFGTDQPEGNTDRARMVIADPYHNPVRHAYRTSPRFRQIFNRLRSNPTLELEISRNINPWERVYFDKTILRIHFRPDGGIARLQAHVLMWAGEPRTLPQRLGHELAHIEEILEKQMSPDTMARHYPDQAFPVRGFHNHFETFHARDAEQAIAAEVADGVEDVMPETLVQFESVMFGDVVFTAGDVRRKRAFYRKLGTVAPLTAYDNTLAIRIP